MTLLLGYAIKSSLVLVAALVGVRLLRRCSAAFRHLLLAAAILAAASMPLLTMLLPTRDIPLPSAVAEFTPEDVVPPVAPLNREEQYYEIDAVPSAEVAAIPAVQIETASSVDPSQLLFWLWITGVVVLLADLVVGVAQLMWLSRRARVLTHGAWAKLAVDVSRQYALSNRIRLLVIPGQTVLATWGVFRPKLLLPEDASSWSEERIRVVLHHELAHVRRYDWLIQMTAEVFRAVYWFNPLSWIACEALVQESEQACDDIALSCGIDGPDYAQQLLALTVALQNPAPVLSAASMARPSTLERRFTALLNPHENRRTVTRVGMVFTVVAFFGLAGPIASLRMVAEPLHMTLPQPFTAAAPQLLQILAATITAPLQQTPLALPQNIPAPQGQVPTGAGAIEGMVVKFGTTEPIAGATVSLQRLPTPGANFVPPTNIQSGPDGKFAFPDLAAGTYRLVALRADGFVVGEFGQQTFNGRGRPLALVEGQRITNIALAMMPTGSISGRIMDGNGEPLGRAQVQALQATYREGRRILKIIQSVQTNDVGEYRLFWLPPGPYYISARPEDPRRRNVPLYVNYPGTGGVFEQGAPPVVMHRVSENGTISEEAFVLVYYPGTPDFPTASRVDLRPGDSLGGINFAVGSGQVPSRHVRGRAIDANGQPVTGNVMAISRTAHPNATIPSATVSADGRFDISGVAPGSYYIIAGNPPGIVPVEISGSDVENVTVISKPGLELTGRIIIEGKPALETDPDLVRLQANCPGTTVRCLPIRFNLVAEPALIGFPSEMAGMPMPGMPQAGSGVPNGAVLADGTFTFRNLNVRDHRLASTGLPQDWYIKSAKLGTVDPISALISFPSPPAERLEVVIGTNGGRLEGKVVNATGQAVASATAVLVPQGVSRARRDLYRNAVTDEAGVFRFQSIAPGDYKVFAWEEIEVSSWLDQEIVRPYESRGKAIRINEGSRETVEAVVIPAPR